MLIILLAAIITGRGRFISGMYYIVGLSSLLSPENKRKQKIRYERPNLFIHLGSLTTVSYRFYETIRQQRKNSELM